MRLLVAQGAAHRGGAERVLLALARHLPRAGVEPVVGFFADGPFVDECRAAGVTVRQLGGLPRARELWRAGAVIDRIAAAARAEDADVVLANGEKLAPYVGVAARRTGRCAAIWLHDAPVRSPSSAALQLAMRAAPYDVVIAGSHWMAERFRQWWRLPVHVVPHGIDLDSLPTVAAPLRAEAGWPEDAEVVLLAGRLQHWKGADVFLRAAARIARRRPRARFAVVGGALYGWEEPFAASLPVLAEDLGIGSRTWFAGHRDDAVALMAAADVVAHCSRRVEPFGLVVPEAMAMARAVVATRTLGPEEVIDHGRTGLLTTPGDDRELAVAVLGLLGDSDGRKAMGEAAAERVRTVWSAEAMAEGFARELQAAVER